MTATQDLLMALALALENAGHEFALGYLPELRALAWECWERYHVALAAGQYGERGGWHAGHQIRRNALHACKEVEAYLWRVEHCSRPLRTYRSVLGL